MNNAVILSPVLLVCGGETPGLRGEYRCSSGIYRTAGHGGGQSALQGRGE